MVGSHNWTNRFEAIPGHGVKAVADGKEFYMGGPAMLKRFARGQASIYLLTSTAAVAAFTVADAVRPESREAIQRLHEQGIEVVMLTGDAKAVATAVAADLGIDTVFAEVLPGDKVDKIKELKAQGKRVAMVGDGVNDAPALLTADVAVAIGAGTDVAVEAGDVVLVRSDPRDVPRIIALRRASYSEDDAEPLVGRGLQHRRDPVGGRRPGGARDSASAGFCGCPDVGKHGHRGDQRAIVRRAKL